MRSRKAGRIAMRPCKPLDARNLAAQLEVRTSDESDSQTRYPQVLVGCQPHSFAEKAHDRAAAKPPSGELLRQRLPHCPAPREACGLAPKTPTRSLEPVCSTANRANDRPRSAGAAHGIERGPVMAAR